MNHQDLVVTKVTPQCGAEVSGLNLAEPLEEPIIQALSMALADHGVLFFRDQPMTAEQQKRLGSYFGDLHLHPAWPRLVDGHPEVMELLTDENSTYIAGEAWHSDVSCDPRPPLGTILQMLEVPPAGGDTLFANMVAAFAALPAEQQQYLSGLTALHDGERVWVNDDGKLSARTVAIAGGDADTLIIADGLQPGDELVVSALSLPIEGTPVTVIGGDQ